MFPLHRAHRSWLSAGMIAPVVALVLTSLTRPAVADQDSLSEVVADARTKVVKIFGAGGPRRLEGYQSGFLISPEGHVITAWSYVLDEGVTVVLDDGTRYEAEFLGADPRTEIAVLKLPHEGPPLPHFRLTEATLLTAGDLVLAFSNLYKVAAGNEPVSVQYGQVALRGRVTARRGASRVPMVGDVYVLDALTSNPGSAGGVVTDVRGRPVGMIGKEAKSDVYYTWLNYAVPMSDVAKSALDILEGRLTARRPETPTTVQQPLTLEDLGLVLVPDVIARTPPYIDATRPGTPANEAGILPDDLVVLVNDVVIGSCRELRDVLAGFDRRDRVRLAVSRDGELITVELRGQTRAQESEMP